ncbi:MAG: cytochrome c, partial [Priestia megaterium]
MKRNPLIPFLLIAVIGIALMLTLSFNGLNNAKEIAAEKEGG